MNNRGGNKAYGDGRKGKENDEEQKKMAAVAEKVMGRQRHIRAAARSAHNVARVKTQPMMIDRNEMLLTLEYSQKQKDDPVDLRLRTMNWMGMANAKGAELSLEPYDAESSADAIADQGDIPEAPEDLAKYHSEIVVRKNGTKMINVRVTTRLDFDRIKRGITIGWLKNEKMFMKKTKVRKVKLSIAGYLVNCDINLMDQEDVIAFLKYCVA